MNPKSWRIQKMKWTQAVVVAAVALAFSNAGLAVADQTIAGQAPTDQTLIDLRAPDVARQWQVVNDGVMGGVSKGQFRLSEDGTLVFSGTLSLKNNGGFASIRCSTIGHTLKADDSIVVTVKGDGRDYILNLYTKSRRMAFSYRAPLIVPAGDWADLVVPLSAFVPTSFGRRVQGMGPVDPSQVRGIGFMLSDKKPGPFELQVRSISVRPAND
jgi:NADH dehydrogenase [ubiquinone] 1 alpha subcomplex assembly factor 1